MRVLVLVLVLVFPTIVTSDTYVDYGSFTQKIKVRTYNEIKYKNIIKQERDYSCGLSSLATILNMQYKTNYTEKYFLSKFKNSSEKNKESGYTLLDIKKIAIKEGFHPKALFLSESDIRNLIVPALVHVKLDKDSLVDEYNDGHFSILYGVKNNNIFLLDPSLGNVTMRVDSFLKKWIKNDKKKGIAMFFYKNGKITKVINKRESVSNRLEAIQLSEEILIKGQTYFLK